MRPSWALWGHLRLLFDHITTSLTHTHTHAALTLDDDDSKRIDLQDTVSALEIPA